MLCGGGRRLPNPLEHGICCKSLGLSLWYLLLRVCGMIQLIDILAKEKERMLNTKYPITFLRSVVTSGLQILSYSSNSNKRKKKKVFKNGRFVKVDFAFIL